MKYFLGNKLIVKKKKFVHTNLSKMVLEWELEKNSGFTPEKVEFDFDRTFLFQQP